MGLSYGAIELIYGAHRDAFKRGGVEGTVYLGGDLLGWAIGLIYGANLWG